LSDDLLSEEGEAKIATIFYAATDRTAKSQSEFISVVFPVLQVLLHALKIEFL
jgi:hypothetical protein